MENLFQLRNTYILYNVQITFNLLNYVFSITAFQL